MSTTESPGNLSWQVRGAAAPLSSGALRLDPLIHGTGRVPGQRGPTFDLTAFARAAERHDVGYLLARYAPDAVIRVVDPDNPPLAARTISGTDAIWSWLDNSAVGVEVTHLVDGGDRVAFTERWAQPDGTMVLATSTAELSGALVTTQHTVLAWAHSPVDPSGG